MNVRVHLLVDITKMFMSTCGRMQQTILWQGQSLSHGSNKLLVAALAVKGEITSLGEIFNARYT